MFITLLTCEQDKRFVSETNALSLNENFNQNFKTMSPTFTAVVFQWSFVERISHLFELLFSEAFDNSDTTC